MALVRSIYLRKDIKKGPKIQEAELKKGIDLNFEGGNIREKDAGTSIYLKKLYQKKNLQKKVLKNSLGLEFNTQSDLSISSQTPLETEPNVLNQSSQDISPVHDQTGLQDTSLKPPQNPHLGVFLRQRINRSKKPKTDLNHDLNNSQTFSSDDGFGFNFTPKNQSGLLKHSLNLEFNSQDHLSVGSQISLQIPPEQGPEIKFS